MCVCVCVCIANSHKLQVAASADGGEGACCSPKMLCIRIVRKLERYDIPTPPDKSRVPPLMLIHHPKTNTQGIKELSSNTPRYYAAAYEYL